jgi:hypothetical protein
VQVDQQALERAADQQARFLIATNELSADKLSDEALLAVYKGQGSVERGFRFLKDPLFLASSVFVKKPSRLIALSFIMVLCLLVYRLAEQRLRQRLQQSEQTIPNQINKPTDKPTMRLSCSNALKVLNCSIFAWDRPFKLAFYVCTPCITRSSACLALPTNNSIFCLLETAECGLCGRKTCAESFPDLAQARARRTHRQISRLSAIAKELGGRPGTRESANACMPVSRHTLLRLLRRASIVAASPRRVLGVDDWAVRKGQTYGTILVE